MVAVSLVISTYNWPESLRLCLLSIGAQTVLPIEVLIADDGSSVSTSELISEFAATFPVPLIHVWHEDIGFRKTVILNKTIKKATGNYIVQIDGDVILERHFIADHVSVARHGVFIRGTRAHIAKSLVVKAYNSPVRQYNVLSKGLMNRFNAFRVPLLAFLFGSPIKDSRSVRGSNLAYWKSDFIQVNGYNNDLKGWGHEDEELAARFINNGIWKVAIKLKAIQFHLSHDESSRTNEPRHAEQVKKTVENKIKTCKNGYQQS